MQLFLHMRHTFGRVSLRCIFVHLVVVQKLAQPLIQSNNRTEEWIYLFLIKLGILSRLRNYEISGASKVSCGGT